MIRLSFYIFDILVVYGIPLCNIVADRLLTSITIYESRLKIQGVLQAAPILPRTLHKCHKHHNSALLRFVAIAAPAPLMPLDDKSYPRS